MSRGFWGPDNPSKAEGFVMAEIQDSGRVTNLWSSPRPAKTGQAQRGACGALSGHSPTKKGLQHVP